METPTEVDWTAKYISKKNIPTKDIDKLYKEHPLLEILTLEDNKLTSIPANITLFSATLRELWLSGNSFEKTIPLEVLQLTSLRELNLSNCLRSPTFPTSIPKFQNLELFYLGGNAIQKWPSIIFQFDNLKALDLSSNYVSIY